MKERLAFLDILRIAAIGFVTLQHFLTHDPFHYAQYELNVWFWNGMYQFDWGKIGVVIFFFVSGFSLAISHLNIGSWKEIKDFYEKRLLRIYPAYYVALVFCIIVRANTLQNNFTALDYFKIVTGLQALGARTEADIYGKINGDLWFLTPLILLYLMFPLLVYAIRKHPHISIATIFVVDQASLYYFSTSNGFFGANWWFPLSVVFEFSLGIYLTRLGFYPKTLGKNRVIIYLSNITYYLFLVNTPLLVVGNYPIVFVTGLLVMATMLYKFDQATKETILEIKRRARAC